MFLRLFILLCFLSVYSFSIAGVVAQDNAGGAVLIPPPVDGAQRKPQSLPTQEIDLLVHASGERVALSVEIADDPEERRVGMMFREYVPPKTGMLFIFDDVAERSFWMKNTFVSLDLLFIDEHGLVHHIHENAEPKSLRLLPSDGPVRAVLELGGGEVSRLGIDVGDRLEYEFANDQALKDEM